MLKISNFVRYHLPPLLWAFLIMIASSIPAKYLSPLKIFEWDKLAHILAFSIFGILIYRSLINRRKTFTKYKFNFIFTILVVIIFGIFDEFYQSFIPNRQSDIYDLAADTIGGFLAITIIYFVNRYSKSKIFIPTDDKYNY